MASIRRVEALLLEQENRVQSNSPGTPVRDTRVEYRLTLKRQLEIDEGKTIEVRTGLSQEEFKLILGFLEEEEVPIRRGRKLLDIDIRLVMFLQWLRFGETYDKIADSFHLKRTRVQTAISDLWDPMIRVLTVHLLPRKPMDYHPTRRFDNFPQAAGALDATLIPVMKPLDSRRANRYLSGKHRKHGVRLQVLVAPDGRVIHYGGIIEGSRHDFILYQESGLSRDMLTTIEQADGTRIPTRPAILADGGYQGIAATYPEAIIPRRRMPNSRLSDEDLQFNARLGHDRVTVERYFGRMKSYWGIIQKRVRLDKINLDGLLKILVCLTNLKLERAPLFAEETIYNPDPEYDEEEEPEETLEEGSSTNGEYTPQRTPPRKHQRQVGTYVQVDRRRCGCKNSSTRQRNRR